MHHNLTIIDSNLTVKKSMKLKYIKNILISTSQSMNINESVISNKKAWKNYKSYQKELTDKLRWVGK